MARPRGARHLVVTLTNPGHRGRVAGQTGVLDRRQHPRRADREHRRCCTSCISSSTPMARHRTRPPGHAAARHAHDLPLPAPEPRRRRARALADRPRHIRSSTRRYPFDELPVDGLTVDRHRRRRARAVGAHPDPHGTYKRHPQEPRLMVPREPGEFGAASTSASSLKARSRPMTGSVDQRPRDPEGLTLNQLPDPVAAGVRAGRRRALPGQRARGAGDGGLHRQALTSAPPSATTPTVA